jgi:hypothetical protein
VAQAKVHKLRFNQPRLLDADFTELNFTRIMEAANSGVVSA